MSTAPPAQDRAYLEQELPAPGKRQRTHVEAENRTGVFDGFQGSGVPASCVLCVALCAGRQPLVSDVNYTKADTKGIFLGL